MGLRGLFLLLPLFLSMVSVVEATPYAYADSGAIQIRGDANFTRENGVVGGNGTPESPYLIRAIRIPVTNGTAIEVSGTRAHVRIEGNWLVGRGAGAGTGVRLDAVNNVVVSGNRIEGFREGLRAEFSRATIGENAFEGGETGVVLASSGVILRENRFRDLTVGLAGTDAEVSLDRNAFEGNDDFAVALVGSRGVAVGNRFEGNGRGVFLSEPGNFTLQRNNFVGNQDYGLNVSSRTNLPATENFWGHLSGPSGLRGGLGDKVLGAALVEPWGASAYPDYGNRAPVPDFLASARRNASGEARVALYDASTDPDGNLLALVFEFGDGTRAFGENVTRTVPPREIDVSLTAIDRMGLAARVEKRVNATRDVNLPPRADFAFSPASPEAGVPVLFRDASRDLDGTVVRWAWTFGDGAASNDSAPTHVYGQRGIYRVILTTTDDSAGVGSHSRDLFVGVEAANSTQIVARARASTDVATVGENVTFYGGDSLSLLSPIASWDWNFGDGTTGEGTLVEHPFLRAGRYTVTLLVEDAANQTATATIEVDVAPPPPQGLRAALPRILQGAEELAIALSLAFLSLLFVLGAFAARKGGAGRPPG
ncbi:MAG: PKD domain-containing protein [Methanobacteriota archaeon]